MAVLKLGVKSLIFDMGTLKYRLKSRLSKSHNQ